MKNIVYSNDINECHERIKKQKAQLKELQQKYKVKSAEKSYYQSMYEDAKYRCSKLESKLEKIENEKERGYKQSDNFDTKKSGIYRVYNIHNNKSYVGQSSADVEARCWSHFSDKAKYEIGDWHLDVQAHPENYYYEILVKGVPNQVLLDKLEVYYIGYYRCLTNGYNKLIGGKYNAVLNVLNS